MSARRRFYEVVSAAVADLIEHGFDSQDRIDRWLEEIRRAALAAAVPLADIDDFLRKSLGRVFKRSVSALGRKHGGVSEFTLAQIRPGLHAELERRIRTSANLIKLNRAASIDRTLQRFAGWASSIPAGGSDVASRQETAKQVRRSIAGLPFEERRVVADQGHKLAASINDIVARDGGAIALTWHHVKEGPPAYDARPSHVARDGKVYLLRDSWAVRDGLVKPAGHQYYDEVTAVGEEVSCRCFATYIYSLSALPPEMLTQKGKDMLSKASKVAHDGTGPTAAGTILRTQDGRALFLKRTKGDHAGQWAFPGGKIEDGETPEQAARRETQEETGHLGNDPLVQVDQGDFVTFREDVEEFEPRLNDEHSEHVWAPMGSPPHPLHPGVAETLKKIAENGHALDDFDPRQPRDEDGKWTATGGTRGASAPSHAALEKYRTEGVQGRNGERLPVSERIYRGFKGEEPGVHGESEPLDRGIGREPEPQRQAAGADQLEGISQALDKREWDANGWFEVKDNPISKAGVFQYSEAAILKGGDPSKMINVLLPPDELGSEEAVKSFRLVPWTDDHPASLLGDESQGLVPAEKKGVQGVIGQDVYFKDGILYGNIKVFSEALARKIASGKRELSCGYRCDFVPQEGTYEGQHYQYVQRNVRGNHTASVDKGRRGPDIRVLDAAERFTFSLDMAEEPSMSEKRKDEADGSVDVETLKFIGDSFNSLVGELERKGYSKEYATKIAGKVAAEKGKTGHHDSTDTKVEIMSGTAADANKGEVKDPEGKESPGEKADLKPEAGDRKKARDARDSKRSARDSRRAKDEMTEEEEEAEDACEAAEDAEEEKEDEKDDSKEARDRKAARDRRAGARDARKSARDRRRAKDAKDKGMDAAEVAALVDQRVKSIRQDAAAAHQLYQRISPIIGAFDHAEMSVKDMASYGLKKLGQAKAADGADPVGALDCYLAALGTSREDVTRVAADSAESGKSFLDNYLTAA